MRGAFFLTATLVVAVATACGGSGDRPVLPDQQLQKLVLQEGDLRGYDRFAFAREAQFELNPLLRRHRDEFDHQNGWVARYRRPEPGGRGPLTVASVADVFARDKGAERYFDALSDAERETAAASGLRELPADLGDAAVAVTSARAAPRSVRFVRISWRAGRFVASISATGFAARMSSADVVALARKQNRRLGSG